MGYTDNSIYGLMKRRHYNCSVLLKIGTSRQLVVKVAHTEFGENLCNSLGADIGLQKDEPTRPPHNASIFLRKIKLGNLGSRINVE
jgi:hypothetical protein